MNNRRSFLKMLGLGAIAAPAVAGLVVQVEAAPVSAVAINAKHRGYGHASDLLATQRKINKLHSTMLALRDDPKSWVRSL